jgi:hypothetical protein
MAHTLQDKRHKHLYGKRADVWEELMKTLAGTLIALPDWALPALATGQTHDEGGSLLIVLFFGFGAVILVSQLLPGMGMFTLMLRELLTGTRRKHVAAAGKAAERL